jgi:hypothetical protein
VVVAGNTDEAAASTAGRLAEAQRVTDPERLLARAT